jgi:hypothetical protein
LLSTNFFIAGASTYYANNYQSEMLIFLELLFSGKTLREAFETIGSQWTIIELNQRVIDKTINPYHKIGIK